MPQSRRRHPPLVHRTIGRADALRAGAPGPVGSLRRTAGGLLASPQHVSRHVLVRRLHEVEDRVPLVLLVAPVGYGKTTAVREWAGTTHDPLAWVTVTGEDPTPGRLLRELCQALLDVAPGDEALTALLISPETLLPGHAAARFASAVAGLHRPVTIVLDDLHLLRSRAALDLVVAVAVRLPPGSRLVAMCDHPPRLHLGRLRSEQRCHELGPADLAFSRTEVADLLRQSWLPLDTDAGDELLRRTEGWPAGLRLAVRFLSTTPDPTSAVSEIDGTTGVIADYFRDEILAHLSVETVRFLTRTATLERMCASLCDAALGTSGAAAWLEEIQSLGLFVVPEDGHRQWFRYHRLFRAALRDELRRSEPGEDQRILRRAAEWYEARGEPESAVEHAMAGGAVLTVARIIVSHSHRIDSVRSIGRIRDWLTLIDDQALRRYPAAAVLAAWSSAHAGDPARAHRALLMAMNSPFEDPLPSGSAPLEAVLAGVRAALAPDGVEGMLADAERAERLQSPGTPWHSEACQVLGVAKWLTGSPEEAARAFEQAARFGRELHLPAALCALGERALMAVDDEDWATAAACARQAQPLLESTGLGSHLCALPVYLAAAQVALQQGDTRQAWSDSCHALHLYQDPSPIALPWLAVQAAVGLGQVLAALGDTRDAERRLAEARRHLSLMPTAGILADQVDRLAAFLETDVRREQVTHATGLTRAELRVLSLLPTHYTLSDMATELQISRNTVKSHVAAIYRKLEASTRAEAVRHAQDVGLLDA